jgi:hypothetical protein
MSSDDWAKIPKTRVNVIALMNRNPQHKNCSLCIKYSKKNLLFTGLYCVQHDHWLTWLNDVQIDFMKKLDSTIIDYTLPNAVEPKKKGLRLRDAPSVPFGRTNT